MSKSPNYQIWIEVETGEPVNQDANRPTENFCNIEVKVDDGRRYALNVWTYDFLPYARFEWPYEIGLEEKASSYVLPPDIFIERLDRPTVERAVKDLFDNNEMQDIWLCDEEE